MQYYKFPDYTISDRNKFFMGARFLGQHTDLDICEKGSNQLIIADTHTLSRLRIRITKLNIDGEISDQELHNDRTNGYRLVQNKYQIGCQEQDYHHVVSKNLVKIIQYNNNKPSALAVLAQDTTAVVSGDLTGSVLFYSINGSEDSSESFINLLDFEYKEPDLIPSSMFMDTDSGLLYIAYRPISAIGDNKIIILDCSDLENIRKIAEYIIDEPNRYNNIKQFVVDTASDLIFCLTNNNYGNYDKINVLYHDKVSAVITQRGSYTAPVADYVSYHSIAIKNNYIYTNNINSLDFNNDDANRSKVGLHILKTSDNFQTINYVKSVPIGYF